MVLKRQRGGKKALSRLHGIGNNPAGSRNRSLRKKKMFIYERITNMKGLDGKINFLNNLALYYLSLSDFRWNTHDSGLLQERGMIFRGFIQLRIC